MTQNKYAIKMLSQDADYITVGGYGIIFGGRDLENEYFDDNSLVKSYSANPPVFYEHGREDLKGDDDEEAPIPKSFGHVTKAKKDKIGWWVEAQLRKAEFYTQAVMELMKKGALGWSSGAIPHLSKRTKSGYWKSWTVGEWSLTATPMEPRTLGVERLKALNIDLSQVESTSDEPEEYTITIKGGESVLDLLKNKSAEEDEQNHKAQGKAVESDESVENVEKSVEGESAPEDDEMSDKTHEKNEPVAEAGTDASQNGIAELTKSIGELTALVGTLATSQKETNDEIEALKSAPVNGDIVANAQSASVIEKNGETEADYIKAWATNKTQDPWLHLEGDPSPDYQKALKASNPVDMVTGTAAAGGNLTRRGFYDQIIMKRGETDLVDRGLPVMMMDPSDDQIVDIPTEETADSDGDFIETAEGVAFDEDSPEIGQKESRLKYYTKFVEVSIQLLMSAANRGGIEGLLSRYFGKKMASTKNEALVTEILTNGTKFADFGSNSAFAFGDPEKILGATALSNYMDEEMGLAWLLSHNTKWLLAQVVGDDRQYFEKGEPLVGFDMYTTNKMPTIAASAKTLAFGNMQYVAVREGVSMSVLRNPYSLDTNGKVRFTVHFACAHTVTQADAVGYGQHPA